MSVADITNKGFEQTCFGGDEAVNANALLQIVEKLCGAVEKDSANPGDCKTLKISDVHN